MMTTYKTFVTIDNPDRVVLSNLPFQKGQRVRVVVLAADDERETMSQQFRELFRKTQNLPRVSEITEADIAAEIAAYRQGK